MTKYAAQMLVAGSAEGEALAADEPISFWGGLDPNSGEIVDRRHPLTGQIVTGKVLVIPTGRGSCSASGVLLESFRNRTGPAAIIISQIDPVVSLGAVLADELLGIQVPVALLDAAERATIQTGDRVRITDGFVETS